MLPKKSILGAHISQATQAEILDVLCNLAKARESSYICFSNVHMVIEAVLTPPFKSVLNHADIAAPDGKPLSIAMNVLYGTQQEQITGPDILDALFARCVQENLSIFLYGSTPDVLDAMRQKLSVKFPTLQVGGALSPPFRTLSEPEQQEIQQEIIQSGANIVLVGLGCPKQELWMAKHKGLLPAVMLGIGAAFPFYTGHLKRCPAWMKQYALEWLFRLGCEPKRLFKRYFYTNILFLILISGQIFQHVIFRKKCI